MKKNFFRICRLKPKVFTIFILLNLPVLLNVPVFAGIIALTYFSNHAIAVYETEKGLARFQADLVNDIQNQFSTIRSLARSAATIAQSDLDFFVSKASHSYLQSLVLHSPQIISAYIGLTDGSFIQSRRISPDDKDAYANLSENAKFVDRKIAATGNKTNSNETYVYRDTERNLLGEYTSNTEYDPRNRPWYKAAVKTKDITTTDPYIFASLAQIGFTVAAPFFYDGKVAGVVAIDITSDSFSAGLSERKASRGTQSFVLTEQGSVIGSSTGTHAIALASGGLKLSHITALEDALPGVAFGNRPRGENQSYLFDYNGSEYLASISSLEPDPGKKWQVFTITPMSDFLALFDRNNSSLLIIGICAVLLQILVVLILSGRIARPLEQLAVQVTRIQNFKTDKTQRIQSSVKEIATLSTAVDTLSTAVSSFTSFVPVELVNKLVVSEKGMELGGRTEFLTIFFSDIESFSSLSEKTPSPELMRKVSKYFEITTEAIEKENGTTDKFIGDGVMAFWGAPTRNEEHAWNACAAAIRIQRKMDELNKKWSCQNSPPLNVRIGLHSDAVLVGNIGSKHRMNYTVMGDGVNIAARLEGVNKDYKTRICISHSVYREAGDRLCVRPIEEVTVKGRRSKILIYELMGVYGSNDPSIEPSASEVILAHKTYEAFEALREGSIEKARELYKAILDENPTDGIAKIVLKRLTIEGT